MKVFSEPGVLSRSERFFSTPSATARRLFYYVTRVGHYYYDARYNFLDSCDIAHLESHKNLFLTYVRSGTMYFETDQLYCAERGQIGLVDCRRPHHFYTKGVKTDFSAGELLWMGMQAMQIDNSSLQFFTLPGYGKMSTAGTSVQYSFFFPYYDQTLELVNKYFNPYEEPISKLDIVGGPDTTTYSGGYVSSGEENNVWGDTSGSYDYSEDYYEEPDYSYDEPSYDNSGSDGDYSDNNDYSGGDSGGDYSGGDSGEESGGDSSGGDYTDGGGEDSGASSGGDDGGTYDPEA